MSIKNISHLLLTVSRFGVHLKLSNDVTEKTGDSCAAIRLSCEVVDGVSAQENSVDNFSYKKNIFKLIIIKFNYWNTVI